MSRREVQLKRPRFESVKRFLNELIIHNYRHIHAHPLHKRCQHQKDACALERVATLARIVSFLDEQRERSTGCRSCWSSFTKMCSTFIFMLLSLKCRIIHMREFYTRKTKKRKKAANSETSANLLVKATFLPRTHKAPFNLENETFFFSAPRRNIFFVL